MRRRLLTALILLVLAITGCSSSSANQPLDSQRNQELVIMTSFYPLYIMTLNVVGDLPGVKVVNLTPPQTGCLHDYQLRPSDMKNLAAAQIFVINGADMESFMDKVKGQYTDLKIIVASEGAELIKDEETGEVNPHLWVSISGAIYEVEKIAAGLAAADPQNAEQYKKNARQYVDKLKSTQAKMQAELKGVTNRNIITFHEAFPYFAQEFNLHIVSVIAREPGSAPSAAELAATVEQIRDSKAQALFAEPQYSEQAADIISSETGIKVYILDPGVTGDNHPDAYLQAMEKNLTVLKEALQ